jgi:molybdopterin synthase catalytic subunit
MEMKSPFFHPSPAVELPFTRMIELREHPFDPFDELVRYQTDQAHRPGHYGATSLFVGTLRDFNEGDIISAMHLEHYPGMTESELTRIIDEACRQWSLLDALVIHRVGRVTPHQTIVLAATWSAHRQDAFAATRHIVENLKHRAPFWKRETLAVSGRDRWVERNTPG